MRVQGLTTNTARLNSITQSCLRGHFLSLISAAKLLYQKKGIRVSFSDGRAFLDAVVWKDELSEAGFADLNKVGKIMERLLVNYSAAENGAGKVVDLNNIYSSLEQKSSWQCMSNKQWRRLIKESLIWCADATGNGANQERPSLSQLKHPLTITVSDIELNQQGLTGVRERLLRYIEKAVPMSPQDIRFLLGRVRQYLNVYSHLFIVVHIMTMLANDLAPRLPDTEKKVLVPVYVALGEYFEVQSNFNRSVFAYKQAAKLADPAEAGPLYAKVAELFEHLDLLPSAANAWNKAARLTEDYSIITAYYRRAADLYLRVGLQVDARVAFINAAQFVATRDGERAHETRACEDLIDRADACREERPGWDRVTLESLED